MDQKRIGNFLKELRHEKNITQQQLSEYLHVTNKTISRWETGTYMPDLDLLMNLSNFYHVSINEILSGQRLTLEEFRQQADNNLIHYTKDSVFTVRERMDYFEKKWTYEHILHIVIILLFPILFSLLGMIYSSIWLILIGFMASIAGFLHLRFRIMDYVDHMVFDKDSTKEDM